MASCSRDAAVVASSEGTKVIYHIDEEETPYLVKVNKPPSQVTLADFKAGIPVHFHKYKYFFKSKDDDFGVVKEEIFDDAAKLPLFNGRVVSWLVAAEGSVLSMSSEQSARLHINEDLASSDLLPAPPPGAEREAGVGETRPPSFHGGAAGGVAAPPPVAALRATFRPDPTDRSEMSNTETESLLSSRQEYFDDTESSITSVSQIAQARRRRDLQNSKAIHAANGPRHGASASHRPPPLPGPGIPPPSSSSRLGATTETSSMISSEIESSICDDTDEMQSLASSRFTTSTDHTSVSRNMVLRQRQKKKSKRKMPSHLIRAGSISSVTDSTLSLNIITVTLNMDTVNFLGISIVGQSNINGDGDCGIYVGSIMKGGAVALDGRIEPGDMILQVNDISFENMPNDEAVRVLREVVQKSGPIKLVVAKSWDQGKNYFTLPRTEPVRPIDPGAWVAHTAAVREIESPRPPPSYIYGTMMSGQSREPLLGDYPGRVPSVTTLSASSVVSSHAETEKFVGLVGSSGATEPPGSCASAACQSGDVATLPLSVDSGMVSICKAMRDPGSGLEVRDRTWLKIKICNAFIGCDAVDWLFAHVAGLKERREAKKYVTQMLKAGFIKHTVNKATFSEQCYYTFGEDPSLLAANLASMQLVDGEAETLPLPALAATSTSASHLQPWACVVPATGRAVPVSASQAQWELPWAGPQPTTDSVCGSTSYGGIYNPVPPPSANYTSNYSSYGSAPYESTTYGHHHGAAAVVLAASSGSSHHSENTRLLLAGSGSGSESISDGRSSSIAMASRFRPHNANLYPHYANAALNTNRDPNGSNNGGPAPGSIHRPQAVFQVQ